MKRNKSILRAIPFVVCLFLLLPCFLAYSAEVDKITPAPGTQLPQVTVGVPDSPEVQKYLGLKNNQPFKLGDISGKMVIIEFFNVF